MNNQKNKKSDHEFTELTITFFDPRLPLINFGAGLYYRLITFFCIKKETTWRELEKIFVKNPKFKTTKQTLNEKLNRLIKMGWIVKTKDETGRTVYRLNREIDIGRLLNVLKQITALLSIVGDEFLRLVKALEINDIETYFTYLSSEIAKLIDSNLDTDTLKNLQLIVEEYVKNIMQLSEKIKEVRSMKAAELYSAVEFETIIANCMESVEKTSLALRRAIDLHRAAKLLSDQEALRLFDKIMEAEQKLR
ncbi:hypothetical protein KEJ45_04870 [Candidatus Bathyarchaeota archaeon]|nr:hypothetical protein [Candidatus Bathyarchaeota archaeon]